jgi:formimidoylglutamate deiminase
VGQNLWQKAATGGAQSTSSNTGSLAVGKQADLLVLNEKQTRLYANNGQHLLDSVIFASRVNIIQDVMVNGHWVVRNGEHAEEQSSADNFATLLTKLSS